MKLSHVDHQQSSAFIYMHMQQAECTQSNSARVLTQPYFAWKLEESRHTQCGRPVAVEVSYILGFCYKAASEP